MRNSDNVFIIAIAALSIVAVCTIGATVGIGLGAFDSPAPAKVAATQAASQANASEVAVKSESAASKSSEASTTSPKSDGAAGKGVSGAPDSQLSSSSPKSSTIVDVTKASRLIDLANPDDYYDVNIFLSNFAEWGEFYQSDKSKDGEIAFDIDNYDTKQLVNWAMWHNALNDNSSLIRKSVDLPNAPATQASKKASDIKPTSYPRHMNTALVEQTIERYFGIDINLTGYNSGDGSYYERDGKLYEGVFRESVAPRDIVALADSVKCIDGKTVCVDFTIYNGNSSSKTVVDKEWYGLNGSKLKKAMSTNGAENVTTAMGTAYIEVVGSGTDRTFHLLSFEVDGGRIQAL